MQGAPDLTILLVEDNPDHAELTLRALQDSKRVKRVFWVKDGEQALDFLHRRGSYADPAAAARPSLILLDLKVPKVNGHEVLRQIKADEELQPIPVVMLTTSARDEEVAESYAAGANSFITKPAAFADFVEWVRRIEAYWVLTNRWADAVEASTSCAVAR